MGYKDLNKFGPIEMWWSVDSYFVHFLFILFYSYFLHLLNFILFGQNLSVINLCISLFLLKCGRGGPQGGNTLWNKPFFPIGTLFSFTLDL